MITEKKTIEPMYEETTYKIIGAGTDVHEGIDTMYVVRGPMTHSEGFIAETQRPRSIAEENRDHLRVSALKIQNYNHSCHHRCAIRGKITSHQRQPSHRAD